MFKIKIGSINFSSLIIQNKKFLSKKIQTIGIVGSGQMGTGIAYVFGR
jgi:predicted homoserine dehydrogenase-like protein